MLIDTITTTPYENIQGLQEKLKGQLLDYYRSNNEELNYEYKNSKKYEVIFITGKNGLENTVNRFYLPIYFKTVTGKQLIFVDVRSCVNIDKNESFTTLSEIVRDKSLYDIKLTHLGLVCEYIEKEMLDSEYLESLIKIFTVVLTNLITNNLRLDILDSTGLKYVIGYYYTSIIYPDKSHDHKLIITTKTLASINKVDEVEKIIQTIPDEVKGVNDLLFLIQKNIPDNRAANLNKTTIYLIMSSMLYGVETKQLLTVALENGLLFAALVYNAYENRIFKRTALFSILKTQGKFIDLKEFLSKTELYLKHKSN